MRRALSDIPRLSALKERIAVMRRLLSLLLALGALTACNEKPPGQLEPIPHASDYKAPPKTEAPKPAEAPPPPVDPNKVVLRWKLAQDTPVAYRLDGTPGTATFYVLQRPKAGDLIVRLATQGAKPTQDQGTFSERGFILDGLGNVDRNLATLVLELPKEPMSVGGTWSLGVDLLNSQVLGRGFSEKKADRHNTVKLTAVTPEGDDQVATIEYDILESVSGTIPPDISLSQDEMDDMAAELKQTVKGKGKGKAKAPEKKPQPTERTVGAQVAFTGKGEFLVKAGKWRSWEGTLTSSTEGYTAPSPDKAATQVPPGALKLKLTALDSVPADLQPSEAKK